MIFALEPPLRTCTTEILSLVAEWRVGIRFDGAGHGTFSAWLRGSGNHGNTLDGVVPRGSVTHLYVLLLLRRLSLGTQVLVSFFVTFCLRFVFLVFCALLMGYVINISCFQSFEFMLFLI